MYKRHIWDFHAAVECINYTMLVETSLGGKMCICCHANTVFCGLYKVLLMITGFKREVEVENEAENDEQSYTVLQK